MPVMDRGVATQGSTGRGVRNPLALTMQLPAAQGTQGKAAAAASVTQVVVDGLFSVLYTCADGASMYRPVAALCAIWECIQVFAFCLSPSPWLPWQASADLTSLTTAFQAISFGYYLPRSSSAAQFAIMFAIAGLTVLGTLVLLVAAHPAWEEARLQSRLPFQCLRWLLVLTSQALYLPVVMQLMSTFRCDATVSFLTQTTCWSGTQVGLAIGSGIILAFFVPLAAVAIVTLFDHSATAKDAYARPHGRVLLAVQVLKLGLAIVFAVDQHLNQVALIICAAVVQVGALFLAVMYLPFHWQRLNQVYASGYAVGVVTGAAVILAAARTDGQVLAAWVLLYTAPWALLSGFMLASLQWHQWIGQLGADVANVYHVELKVRRLLSQDTSESTMEQVDAIYAQAMSFFGRVSILHMFIAQYMHEFRHNAHLEQQHLSALRLSGASMIDEAYFAYFRRNRLQEDSLSDEHRIVATRIKFEKLKASVRDQVLIARRLQVTFWSELMERTPSASRLSALSSSLWDAMQRCESLFNQLLVLNPASVQAVRMYAQYQQDVANNVQKHEELMEMASEMEAVQTRAQTQDRDIFLLASSDTANSAQDNMGVITISSQRDNLGEIIDVNARCLQMLGYTKRELMGKNIATLIPEPISSLHQRFLEAYLDTGRGIVIDATRTLFMLHSSGYLLPTSNTIRSLDNGFSSIMQLLSTSDRLMLAVLPDMVVTAVCQRTIVAANVTPKALRAGNITLKTLFPGIEDVWARHAAAVEHYETAALAEVDLNRHAGNLKTPDNMEYEVPMKPHGDTYGEGRRVFVRFQVAKAPGVTMLLVKWKGEDVLEAEELKRVASASSALIVRQDDAARASDNEQEDASLVGELDTDEEVGDEAPDFGQATTSTGELASPRFIVAESPDGESKETPQHVPPMLQLRSPSPSTKPAASGPGGMRKATHRYISGKKSEGSHSSSSSASAVRKKLQRTMSTMSTPVRRLLVTICALLTAVIVLLAVNVIASSNYLPTVAATLGAMRDNVGRLFALQESALRVQDLVIQAQHYFAWSSDHQNMRLLELRNRLTQFETLHHALYTAVSDDPVASLSYSVASIPTVTRDANGVIRSQKQNLLALGLSMVSEARQAANMPLDQFTQASPSVWFFTHNLHELSTHLFDRLDSRAQSAVALMSNMENIRTIVLGIALAAFGLACLGLLVPLLYKLQRLQHDAFTGFMQIPVAVLRGLHRQADVGLAAAVAIADELDDGELDLDAEKEEDMATQLKDMLKNPAVYKDSGNGPRKFKSEVLQLWKSLCIVLLPVFAIIGVTVGLFQWGENLTGSMKFYAVELQLSGELAITTLETYYRIRLSLIESNVAAADLEITRAAALWDELPRLQAAVSLGTDSDARPALRLPNLYNLLLNDGCAYSIDPQCPQFAHELFQSGLSAAMDFANRVFGQFIAQQQAALNASGNATAALLSSESMTLCDTMMHSLLADPLFMVNKLEDAAANAEISSHLSALITVTIICIIVAIPLFALYYLPRLRRMDKQFRQAQAMLLLLPEELFRGIPAFRDFVRSHLLEQ